VVIGGPNRLGQNFIKLGFKGPGEIFGVEPGRGSEIYLLGFLGFLLTMVPISAGLFTSIRDNNKPSPMDFFFVFGTISLLVPMFVIQENLSYFVLSAKVLAGSGSAIAICSIRNSKVFNVPRNKVIGFFLASGIITLVADFLRELNWLELVLIRGGISPILTTLWFIYIFVAWLTANSFSKNSQTNTKLIRSQLTLTYFSIFLLFGATTAGVLPHLQSLPNQIRSTPTITTFTGTTNETNASEWLRSNSLAGQLAATNRFCVEQALRDCVDPRYYAVSSTTRMRLLIEGPFSVVGYGGDDESLYPKFAKERLDLSRGFADKPTAEIAARLRELGVDWFYLFLDNTENRNWAPFATVEYQNSEVAILKLTDPSS
jgi:hypothetical protein